MKFLKKAIDSHPKLKRYAKNDDAFNSLKGDSRFRKLIDLDYETHRKRFLRMESEWNSYNEYGW